MASLPPDSQPHSSTIVEVAQVTQPNPTMELSTATKDVIAPTAPPSGSWISFTQDNYESFASFQSQPLTHLHSTDHVLHLLSDKQQQPSNPCAPSASPVWRFYSMAAKGLCSKRVEDVKMNRIDKLKAGRRRRPCRRPFVFKSSPLAEGQGTGRFTHFHANPLINSFALGSSSLPSERNDGSASHPANLYDGLGNAHISRLLDPRHLGIQHWPSDQHFEKSISFSAINRSPNIFINSHKQPQISRLRNCKTNSFKPLPSQSTNHYESWEISLPKCSLPKLGSFAC